MGPALIALLADKETLRRARSGDGDPRPGIGLFYPTATTAGVTAVDESRRSLAGAILYMFQIAGGSVGLGLTTTVFIGASDRAQSGSGFIDGIQTAFTLDAAIAVGGFLIASLLIGGRVKLPAALHRVARRPLAAGARALGPSWGRSRRCWWFRRRSHCCRHPRHRRDDLRRWWWWTTPSRSCPSRWSPRCRWGRWAGAAVVVVLARSAAG